MRLWKGSIMAKDWKKILNNPKNVKFNDLYEICRSHFGEPTGGKGSHTRFKTPWPGDPRINIQKDGKMAKVYQVKQVIKCLQKLEEEKKK